MSQRAVSNGAGRMTALAASVSPIPLKAGDRFPDDLQVQVTPTGDFRPTDGRAMKVPAWRIDAQIASRVIERFRQRKNDLVIDYEHQSLHKESNGQPAPAAGWVRDLFWHEAPGNRGGLWATVNLTARANDMVARNEYRYISPVFKYDTNTGEVLTVEMIALTNTPALDGMWSLADAAKDAGFMLATATAQLTPGERAMCAATGIAESSFAAMKIELGVEGPRISDQESAICAATGITPDDFAAASRIIDDKATHALTRAEAAICAATGVTPAAFTAAKHST